ncbi:MAG: polyprenol monophosphomannose synthase [Acidimicrobiales bacterium]
MSLLEAEISRHPASRGGGGTAAAPLAAVSGRVALPEGQSRQDGPPSAHPLVVLPTYNEAGNISEVLRHVRKAVPQATVLVIDDSSPDGTAATAEQAGSEVGRTWVMSRPAKSGLGSAYVAGFTEAMRSGFTCVAEMDSDLSHDPSELPRLLAALDEGADLAIGSRYVPGGRHPGLSPLRHALSRGGNLYAAFTLGVTAKDSTSGFRAYRSSVLERLDLGAVRAEGYAFQIEMTMETARAGGTVVEVPITFAERAGGTSKMSARIVAEALWLCTRWGARDRAWPVRPAAIARASRHGA